MDTVELPSPGAIESRGVEIQKLVAHCEAHRPEQPAPEWILPPASCEFLRDLAHSFLAPRTAFEFGSGRSTHTLREVSARTTSIEHSAEWLDRTEDGRVEQRADHQAAVIPLRRCWNRLRLIESFDLKSAPNLIDSLRRANLILVDSPPNPAKREHILFAALRHASVGSIIVLDDLEVRAVSRFCLRLARQNSHLFDFWKVKIDHQLGVFLKKGDGRIRSWPSLREFVGTWLRA